MKSGLHHLERSTVDVEAITANGLITDFDDFFTVACDLNLMEGRPGTADVTIAVSAADWTTVYSYTVVEASFASDMAEKGGFAAHVSVVCADTLTYAATGAGIDAVALGWENIHVTSTGQPVPYRSLLVIGADQTRAAIRPANHWSWTSQVPPPNRFVDLIRNRLIIQSQTKGNTS